MTRDVRDSTASPASILVLVEHQDLARAGGLARQPACKPRLGDTGLRAAGHEWPRRGPHPRDIPARSPAARQRLHRSIQSSGQPSNGGFATRGSSSSRAVVLHIAAHEARRDEPQRQLAMHGAPMLAELVEREVGAALEQTIEFEHGLAAGRPSTTPIEIIVEHFVKTPHARFLSAQVRLLETRVSESPAAAQRRRPDPAQRSRRDGARCRPRRKRVLRARPPRTAACRRWSAPRCAPRPGARGTSSRTCSTRDLPRRAPCGKNARRPGFRSPSRSGTACGGSSRSARRRTGRSKYR